MKFCGDDWLFLSNGTEFVTTFDSVVAVRLV